MRDLFVRPLTITRLIGKNAVEVELTEEFSRNHPVFPVSLVRTYHQTGEHKLPSSRKKPTPQEVVELEDYPWPVKQNIKARNIRLNGKGHRKYQVIFKTKTADKDKWLSKYAIQDCNLHLRRLRASRRAQTSHQ
ncbi:hypothetical protein O181_021093 [Austropuccinia psidii MF-1]|uniref:Chromo domain-containing protein n=1 Tax=Austropuccinia psidii MF-1 TaxID=1389203 RepID=A0A9Q3CE86_9BASI|nr:hypothetical protein [Austropuccinia psidii MF-1]